MVGAAAFQFLVGRSVQMFNSYTIPFIVAGTLYFVALLVIHLFVPKTEVFNPLKRANMFPVCVGGLVILAGLAKLQYEVNKPPYLSLKDYQVVRKVQLKSPSGFYIGPEAKVGWMDARWYYWGLEAKPGKIELVKIDTEGRPFVEPKGAAAARYKGPKAEEVWAAVNRAQGTS